MKNFVKISLLLFLILNNINAKVEVLKWNKLYNSSFAIVTDKITFEKCGKELKAYAKEIENQYLSCYLLIIENEDPQTIKSELEILYKKSPRLEGAVFIGDVPIPMLRDAQHLTSAYKKNQNRGTWFGSSVPSDRYYEDFDLKFKFLKRDSTHSNCFYFSLEATSPQFITKDIYSGRIKAPINTEKKYELIKKYLKKVVSYKQNKNTIKNGLMFMGHGYVSESLAAWNDEFITSKEQFPLLFTNGGKLKSLYFSMSTQMKTILMRELENKKLDIAIFHAHGASDTQYLIEYPKPQTAKAEIEDIKLFLRHKLRAAKRHKKELEEFKKHYIKDYGITENWFDGTFSDSVITADSLLANSLDIYSKDLETFKPQAKFIMFDECFNGSFHEENYLAGKYIFSNGNVIASTANTVNVLQDVWSTRFLGLLDLGVSVGRRHLFVNYLENHIVGDPTLTFATTNQLDLGKLIIEKNNGTDLWKQLLLDKESRIRALAIEMLSQKDELSYQELKNIYNKDLSTLVRMQSLYSVAKYHQEKLNEFLTESVNDINSFIRKTSVKIIGRIGDKNNIPLLINRLFNDECSRVSFTAKNALATADILEAKKMFWNYYNTLPEYAKDNKIEKYYKGYFKRNKKWLEDDILKLVKDNSISTKRRVNACRTFRNYNFVNSVNSVCNILYNEKIPTDIKVVLIEALGWYNYSNQKNEIVKTLETISKSAELEVLKNEAIKSVKRLSKGLNEPFTP